VNEPRAWVTDTHPLLFHAAGGKGLGTRARRSFQVCESRDGIIYVPAAVVWETSLLARAGRVRLGRSVRAFFDDLFANPAYQPLVLDNEQIFLADAERPNSDPFDALICASARRLELPLITRDADIAGSGLVSVVW
jgi:PIN domain nuclease of toxin-antitoxin system